MEHLGLKLADLNTARAYIAGVGTSEAALQYLEHLELMLNNGMDHLGLK